MRKTIPDRTIIERTIEVSIKCLEESRTLPQSDVWLCGKEEASSTVGGLLTEASRTGQLRI